MPGHTFSSLVYFCQIIKFKGKINMTGNSHLLPSWRYPWVSRSFEWGNSKALCFSVTFVINQRSHHLVFFTEPCKAVPVCVQPSPSTHCVVRGEATVPWGFSSALECSRLSEEQCSALCHFPSFHFCFLFLLLPSELLLWFLFLDFVAA